MILSSATEQTLLAALKAVLSHEEGALEQVRAASNLVEADAKRFSQHEVVRTLIATTGHVTREEAKVLDEAGYSRGEYGWLLYVSGIEDLPVIPEIESPSEGLAGAIARARELGCRYLLLDRDADALEGVPVYDW